MEENFSPQESFRLINEMISKTKSNISENSFYFLFWGWLTFICILSQFFLKVVFRYQHHYIVWILIIPAIIITIVHSGRQHKKQQAKTYLGESMSHLWIGVGISFFVLSIIVSSTDQGWYLAYPFFILFYGLGTFVSGRILQFRPMAIGGVFNWMLAIAAAFVAYDYQMLLAATALLTSYIIPGHLLKSLKTK